MKVSVGTLIGVLERVGVAVGTSEDDKVVVVLFVSNERDAATDSDADRVDVVL